MIAAFAAILDPENDPKVESHIERLLAPLSDRAGGPAWHRSFGGLTLGVIPQGPDTRLDEALHIDSELVVLLDGRIDNRDEIDAWLGDEPGHDVKRVLGIYRRSGMSGLARIVGPFLVLVYDRRNRRLAAARDPLGDRSLVYTRHRGQWILSCEERSLLALPRRFRVNDFRIRQYLALQEPRADETYFEDIHELPAAHTLTLSGSNRHVERYWSFRNNRKLRRLSLEDAAAALNERLDEAVAACTRDADQVAVSLSGGADSSAVAASLARIRARPRRLAAFSYRFARYPDCNETEYAEAVSSALGMEQHWVDGDTAVTLGRPDWAQGLGPEDIGVDAYRWLRLNLQRACADNGHTLLLSGDFGDHLYLNWVYWMRDLMLTGRFRSLGHHLSRLVRQHGLGGFRRNTVMRHLLPVPGIRNRLRVSAPEWITDESARRLADRAPTPLACRGQRADINSWVLGTLNGRAARMSHAENLRSGIEIRYPFRNRRVVELLLNLPGWQLQDPDSGETRPVLRRALIGRLPESVRLRQDKTSFTPLLLDALGPGGPVQSLLSRPNALWRGVVRLDWMQAHENTVPTEDRIRLIYWFCAGLELWRDTLPDNVDIDSLTHRG